MDADLQRVLNPRVVKHCLPLYQDGHYKHAALEAMIQVELALKERAREGGRVQAFGARLTENLFGKGQSIKLIVPLGEDLQEKAEMLFKGAFGYYRNYAAHDGSKIDQCSSLRIMVLASELLDLIGACSLSFADVGGIEGLVKAGAFDTQDQLLDLLEFLGGQFFPDEVFDGLFDELLERGLGEAQLQAVIEIGLIACRVQDYTPSLEELRAFDYHPHTMAWFELTDLGREALSAGGRQSRDDPTSDGPVG